MPQTRRNRSAELLFDPEIERALKRLKQKQKLCIEASTSEPPLEGQQSEFSFTDSEYFTHMSASGSDREEMEEQVDENDRCMRDINNCKVDYDPVGLYADNVNFEIKGALLANLPKFHGFAGEDPHRHLRTMYTVCSSMKPPLANLEDVMKRAFHFTLEDKAKEWLYTLPTHFTILTWDQLKTAFFSEYFPDSKTSQLKKEITGVKQFATESMYEYWRRFLTMLAHCPHHGITKNDLVNSYFEGLLPHHKPNVHAAAGGYLRDLSPNAAWELLQKLSNNDHHSGDERRTVSSVSSSDKSDILAEIAALGNRMEKRMNLLERDLSTKRVNAVNNCNEVYENVEDCSALYHDRGNFQKRDPFSNTYNPGWKDHPNFRWKNNQGDQSYNPNCSSNYQGVQPSQPANLGNSKGDELAMIMKGISGINARLDQDKSAAEAKFNKIDAGMQTVFAKLQTMEAKHENLSTFVTQMSNSLNEQQAKASGSMPSNTVINPKSVNAITLRSGKELNPETVRSHEQVALEEVDEENEDHQIKMQSTKSESPKEEKLKEKAKKHAKHEVNGNKSSEDEQVSISDLPFPNSFLREKHVSDDKENQEMYNMFSKLCVNVPLLELVKKIPKYAKFLKELCTNKRKYKARKKVQLGANVSAIFKPQLPIKCKDPGAYTIPITIGNITIAHALLDPGAALNVMPTSVYNRLKLDSRALKNTSTILGLADRTLRYPKGILEDVLVQVKELVFPADFYVLDMSGELKHDDTVILGRPFLCTAETIVNMKKGLITMSIGEHEVTFDLNEAMRRGFEDCSYLGINLIESFEDIDDLTDHFSYEQSWYDLIKESDDIFTCLNTAHHVLSECTDNACVSCFEINKCLSESNMQAYAISKVIDETDTNETFEERLCVNDAGSEGERRHEHDDKCSEKEIISDVDKGVISNSSELTELADANSAQYVVSDVLKNGNDKGSGELNIVSEQRTPSQSHSVESHSVHSVEVKTLVPSIVQPPDLELKPLPANLKYVFLAENEKLPVIISTELDALQESRLINLLKEHKEAIGWSLADIPGISPLVCTHKILLEEGAKPIQQHPRRVNPLIKEVIRKEVSRLLSAGIIYPISDSKWVSPVHVVPKKSGLTVVKNENNELIPTRIQNAWRVCNDYRKLNDATKKDHFPLPFIDQMLERISGRSHYCFLDGFSGYFQVYIAPEDQEKTTFTCDFGTFAYRRMPFGLCNAPGTFQRCMMAIFHDLLEQHMEVFMDDFTVFGDEFDTCLISLEKVLKRCIEKKLILNFEKCHFMVTSGIVLGHLVSEKGIEVDRAKIEVISSLPYPTCVRELRSFLGHAGFYRRFIKDFSKIALPLSNLLKKDCDFVFDDHCKVAFDKIKSMLVSPPILSAPNWTVGFELSCDASNGSVGAMLGQKDGKLTKVIAYASKTLDAAQVNYTTTEKELFAIVFALDKFRQYLIHTHVVIFTDHAAVRYLFKKPQSKPRLLRWALLMQEFDIEIKDRAGAENLVADHLSRLPSTTRGVDCSNSPCDSFPDATLASLHRQDPWYSDLVNFLVGKRFPDSMHRYQAQKLKSEAKYYIWDPPNLWRLCSDSVIRRCVPDAEIEPLISHAHDSYCGGHLSGNRTARRILECGFFWPTLIKDCITYCKACDKCQRFGSWGRKHEMPMQPLHFCEIFDVWGIDFMGPFPSSCGYEYILLAVDYVSRWVEAIPTRKADANIVLKFLRSSIFCRYGVPRAIISDQGTHFCNKSMTTLLAKYGVQHRVASPYHPQTNGLAEVSNREVKRILEKIVNPNKKDWSARLDEALWAYRTAYKTPLNMSPFRIIYGKACHLPLEIHHKSYWAIKRCNDDLETALGGRKVQLQELEELRLEAYENALIYKDKLKLIHDKKILRKVFHEGDKVLMYKVRLRVMPGKFVTRWDGPYMVTKVHTSGMIELKDEATKQYFQTNGHLLKHYQSQSKPP